MVYNARDYWVFGLCPSSSMQKNARFRKVDLFPSSGEGMGDTYFVRSFRNSNLNHLTINNNNVAHPQN
jgi:hypothetical protein